MVKHDETAPEQAISIGSNIGNFEPQRSHVVDKLIPCVAPVTALEASCKWANANHDS